MMYEQKPPPPPPKTFRNAKDKFFSRRSGVQKAEPKAEAAPPNNVESITAGAQRLDIIDQLDISGIAGASCMYIC